MSDIILITTDQCGGLPPLRGVQANEKYWIAAVDLFSGVVRLTDPDKWPRPSRPPLLFVANAAKLDPDTIARPFKSFGVKNNKFANQTSWFLVKEAWASFMVLAEVPSDTAPDLAQFLENAFVEKLASISQDGEDTGSSLTTVSELDALKRRVDSLESKLASQTKRLNRLEYAHDHLLETVKSEFKSLSARDDSSSAETARELKAHANRLYARSKQLESEGR